MDNIIKAEVSYDDTIKRFLLEFNRLLVLDDYFFIVTTVPYMNISETVTKSSSTIGIDSFLEEVV